LASILLLACCQPSTLRSRLNEGAMKILQGTCRAALFAVALFGATGIASAQTQGTIKIGVLHSLSGTMAISETTLKDTILMMVDDINKKGGLLGKKVEAVVVDPASNWPLFAEKARDLIAKEKVAAVFGCWTSVSRKSVLPVFEELNGLCPIRCSTRARKARATSSTPAPRRTSRRSRRCSI
jgi:ABC-type branched-subunit amino acid transport system substrate-binding protein